MSFSLKTTSLRHRVNKSVAWGKENERTISTAAFMGGFGLDLLTLNRIDQFFDNAILASYLLIAIIGIFIINIDINKNNSKKYADHEHEREHGPGFRAKLATVALYATQFAFGGLLSGFVIFYTKSASWYVAWPFLVALYVAFVANDRLRHYYKRLEFQIAALFAAIFALTIFWVPIVTKTIGDWVFILSGLIAITVTIFLLRFFYWLLPDVTWKRRWKARRNIFIIFSLFNILYFTNIIPPIPLSLKQIDVYYDVQRDTAQNNYQITDEQYRWYDLSWIWSERFVITDQYPNAYVFTSVFGPEQLRADMQHQWQWYNTNAEQWIDIAQSNYEITGGRDGGFRWYSLIERPQTGSWRVVVTSGRREMGRINFLVENQTRPIVFEDKSI